jgi:hypothetical protein
MIPRREYFDGPKRLLGVWTLKNDRRVSNCEVWSHECGYELRLMIDGSDFPRTQVCRTIEEIVTYQESWRQALEQQGWTKLVE